MAGDHYQERTQRVRIGLTGLAFVFLLVLLGTAISRSGEDDSVPPPPVEANAAADEPNEPLAELGVAPGQSATANAVADANSAAAAPPPPRQESRP